MTRPGWPLGDAQKWLGTAHLIIILLSLAAVVNPVGAADANLARNGDFARLEGGSPQHWLAIGGRGAADRTRARQGDVSGRLDRSTRGEAYWRQAVTTPWQPGQRYVLSGWVWGEPGNVAFMGVETGGGVGRSGATQLIYRGLAEPGWQFVSMEFQAPTSGSLHLRLGGEFAGSLWWDEVKMTRAEDLPEQLRRDWEARLSRHRRVYTGLVVDTRGLNVNRGMSPRIVDTDGNLLYAGAGADFEWVIQRGIVSYMRDFEQALSHERLAVHPAYPYRLPLIVQAVARINDGLGRDVVVRSYDAQLIRRYLERYDFLARYAVVFLID